MVFIRRTPRRFSSSASLKAKGGRGVERAALGEEPVAEEEAFPEEALAVEAFTEGAWAEEAGADGAWADGA
ncbi:hypothetical protein ACH4SP_21955 [Streptomyces sp. NPDC021093]|uniref:hypothetical protein n=1 Tax=Streptomyces sp. NPDC021093 TaxID=3365112 RepID=UPI003793873D